VGLSDSLKVLISAVEQPLCHSLFAENDSSRATQDHRRYVMSIFAPQTMTMKMGHANMSLRRVEACPKGERQSPAHGHMLKHQKKRISILTLSHSRRMVACSLRLIEKYV